MHTRAHRHAIIIALHVRFIINYSPDFPSDLQLDEQDIAVSCLGLNDTDSDSAIMSIGHSYASIRI